MYLIVGLGNPGLKFRKTRHNAGFKAVNFLVDKEKWKKNKKLKSEIAEVSFENQKIIFAKPQTFMNNSGEAVRALADYYKIDFKNIIIIYDELDLPFGEIRVRENGSSAGHNGIKSIISHLGTEEFWRIRIGIKNKPSKLNSLLKINVPAEKYVLKKFSREELQELEKNIFKEVKNKVEEIVK